jgi:hypothetical protein
MSFLELNGRPISVASFEESVREVGSRAYGLDGTPLVDRLAQKRTWKAETTPLLRGEATAVKAIVQGLGHSWPFDVDDYSDKGLPAESGAVRTLRSGTAADGDPVYLESKYTGAVAVESAITNILGADSRDAENAPTGYSAINAAVLAADASNYWQGTKSLKVTTNGSYPTDGAYTTAVDPGAGSAGKTYSGSVYVKAPSNNELVKIRLYDVTNAAAGPWTYSLAMTADTWYWLVCTITIGGSDCRSIRLEIEEQVGNTVSVFYCDGFQVEENEVPTSWVDGSRSVGVLGYDSQIVFGALDLTVNIWARSLYYDSSSTRYLVFISSDSNANRFVVFRDTSADKVSFTTTDVLAGNWDTLSDTGTWNDEEWHMITAVLRANPTSVEHIKELYVDGVLADYSDPAGVPELTLTTYLEIGSALGGEQFSGGLIDDLLIVPYAASATQIANWYAFGRAQPALPRVLVHGDAIRETDLSVEAIGKLSGGPYIQAVNDGTWQAHLEQLSFELEDR